MILITSGVVGGRCPICGAAHANCGGPSPATPVDQPAMEVTMSGPLKKYRVTVGRNETVMKLTDADAEKLGAVPLQPEGQAEVKAETKKRTPRNKARTAKNKAADAGDKR